MVPATVIDWPNTGLVHHNQVSRYFYRAYILILNFTFEKNVHFNKLTKATHAIVS